ncbi:hypothetical protein [Maribacter polysaccharolyticus]|uniref:hypothetical protein n=1 Tax=Maribacter polysaccharolyticus TaxID=3020831 RepID=UPI00237F83D5|nr:hypothetical protein [Maribacter polysaccharolyticus]MDE3743793.1 hypothetical protein [Maribacter polysaccharolyticus]
MYLGKNVASFEAGKIKGELVNLDNESYYKISNCDGMRPFFMSIVSDSNHWMFISSNGGLTAGRKNSESSLFPYYTDDKITESADITGSKTILHIHAEGKTYLWEPFSERFNGIYNTQRNLYKNSLGNKVVFEETNIDLGITFRYQWSSSDTYGFVRKSTLINTTDSAKKVTVLDGIQNILPYGVSSELQNRQSNLVDAYKRNELDPEVGIGIYALSAIIVDKAEPSEALKASIAWSIGLENVKYLVSSKQLDAFRKGNAIEQEEDIKAEKGAYFICTDVTLQPKESKKWLIVADVNQTMVGIRKISEKLKKEKALTSLIEADIELGSTHLLELNGASDGLQMSADNLRNTRHFSNTLFNIMRGGIFDDNYQIEKNDFLKYLQKANKEVFANKEKLIAPLSEKFAFQDLKQLAIKDHDSDFMRLAFEYMPLKFSRRHGDPSRPWNKFSINTRNEDGSKILDYEGNWRDIFQNWEALAHSYPGFIENMIHKFLNATTFDGYNPYRVTKDGFDWETIEPDDPWSYIGYWGDHQIIYLLKFLEFIEHHYPDKLASYFNQNVFVYANVPYKIKGYADILANPKDTIVFDDGLDSEINKKREVMGADGALLSDKNAVICKANLIEKLLATLLAKISNFIPEGGIWMNTQRPEWNDANNALVGNGVSMVTLYYLRRFLHFFEGVVARMPHGESEISKELSQFFNKVVNTFDSNIAILSGKVSDKDRKTVLDGLGNAGSDYRTTIYENGFEGSKERITKNELLHFLQVSKKYLDHSIRANKRDDKLYHAYNLMTVENDSEVSISYLPEMLEGQVAVLSSGYIVGKDALELLDALKNSALFRPDQYSYILYPNKELPRFYDKNNIPSERIADSSLVARLVKDGNTQIVEKDGLGNYHFNGNFNNAGSLKSALANLPKKQYGALVEKDESLLLATFEEIFNHKAFTGRSGTFFGYEGLGSIYWHMVSKLLLAVQEICLGAVADQEDETIIGRLLDHYYEIEAGIGVHKSPELYGAFPTDPYSHTPAGKGAQQPGMTGQVKEDILSRFGELGVYVTDGKIFFDPRLLRVEEFLKTPKVFTYFNKNNEVKEIQLEEGSLAFTYCQIPIIYKLSEKEGLNVHFTEGSVLELDGQNLDSSTSNMVFERTGEIKQIVVSLKK